MSRKWKIISLGLFVTNMLTLQWLFRTDDERSHAEQWLGDSKWGEGLRQAEKDFREGKVRVYAMEVIPYPAIGQPIQDLTNEFTGRTDGSLEIWAWRRYQPEDKLTLRIWNDYLDGYNLRMTNLYRKHMLPPATNTPPPSNLPSVRARRP